jgi:hypothetical protein
MAHETIIQVRTRGDASTVPGGIALRVHPGGGSFMVQDFYQQEGEDQPNYCCGAYDLTLVEALEEFHRRAARAERYDTGGALIPDSVSTAAIAGSSPAPIDGESAHFAEIVDDEGNRHWSTLIYDASDDDALTEAAELADATGEPRGPDFSLQVRGPFIIPTIPACGMVRD